MILGRLLFLHQRKLSEQRSKKFKDLAEQMGMEFSEKGDSALLESLSAFLLLSNAVFTEISNLLRGDSEELGFSEEFEVRIFDYKYSEVTAPKTAPAVQSVICFQSPLLNLPKFSLRPEDRLHDTFDSRDIDFESYQTAAQFSKKYLLRGEDGLRQLEVRRLFTDEILAFFAAQEGITTEGSGDQLIFYRARKRIKPENTPAFLEEGLEVFRVFTR